MPEFREVPFGGSGKDFLNVVDLIYKGDPAFVRPLDMDLSDRLNPKKNPFFEHARGTIFLAYKSGRCVGRITAHVDTDHLAQHKDETGFFGFLDTIDDQEIATGLLNRAEEWIKAQGLKHVRGPLSLSLNEEVGCLVDGFSDPPAILMPHHRPYQGGLIEGAGYAKEMDFFAWRYLVGDMNARVQKAHDDIANLPNVTSREISLSNIARDTKIVIDIFNDAWSDNWGFVPVSEKEAQKLASDLRMIAIPEITRIVDIDGEPAACAVALPNLNELIPDLHGKLFPTGFAKLLYRLKVKGPKSGRLMLLGIRKKYRFVRQYAPLSLYMYAQMNNSGRKLGMTWGELSWTLENNAPMNTAIRVLGAKKYKTYRVYKKTLA